jgi:hypothetical protein
MKIAICVCEISFGYFICCFRDLVSLKLLKYVNMLELVF